MLTNFKIGYAPSNTLEIYCRSNISWWGESDIEHTLELLALGGKLYLSNTSGTGWSVLGGIGYSGLSEPFEKPFGATNGFGLFIGGGYEFTRHWNIEMDLLYSKITEGVVVNSFRISLAVNFLAY